MAKQARKQFSEITPSNRLELRQWLIENGETNESVWVVLAKKDSGLPYLPVAEVVEELLCFGWIDSVPSKLDKDRFKLLISPRNPKSKWSKVNKDRVKKLIKSKLMTPAGLAVVQQARKSGTWTALDKIEKLIIPPDLKKALNENHDARDNFDKFPKSVKRGILEWIISAKTQVTKDKRIKETVDLASKNIRANQWPRKK